MLMIEQIKICTVAHRIIYEDKKRQMDIKFQTRLPQSDSGADCNKKLTHLVPVFSIFCSPLPFIV